jgi:histidine triad (HIT) family protein
MDCLFCKIIAGDIPADIVYENDHVLAFRDISPQAPQHVLIIPRTHVSTINDFDNSHADTLSSMLLAAGQVTKKLGIDQSGYRLTMNCNEDGGQTVYHVHMHVLGGRRLSWPPG